MQYFVSFTRFLWFSWISHGLHCESFPALGRLCHKKRIQILKNNNYKWTQRKVLKSTLPLYWMSDEDDREALIKGLFESCGGRDAQGILPRKRTVLILAPLNPKLTHSFSCLSFPPFFLLTFYNSTTSAFYIKSFLYV